MERIGPYRGQRREGKASSRMQPGNNFRVAAFLHADAPPRGIPTHPDGVVRDSRIPDG